MKEPADSTEQTATKKSQASGSVILGNILFLDPPIRLETNC